MSCFTLEPWPGRSSHSTERPSIWSKRSVSGFWSVPPPHRGSVRRVHFWLPWIYTLTRILLRGWRQSEPTYAACSQWWTSWCTAGTFQLMLDYDSGCPESIPWHAFYFEGEGRVSQHMLHVLSGELHDAPQALFSWCLPSEQIRNILAQPNGDGLDPRIQCLATYIIMTAYVRLPFLRFHCALRGLCSRGNRWTLRLPAVHKKGNRCPR